MSDTPTSNDSDSTSSSNSDSLFSDDEFDEHFQSTFLRPAVGYLFEPEWTSEELAAQENIEESAVVTNSRRCEAMDWCKCGKCGLMATERECICCNEIMQFLEINQEQNIKCITEHPSFVSACLNKVVLNIAYHQYHQQYNHDIEDS
ncbi:uncharacterized protein LOC144750538 [Ciona intestinalis]